MECVGESGRNKVLTLLAHLIDRVIFPLTCHPVDFSQL